MSISKVQILLQQGENNGVEFKSADVSPDGLSKEFVQEIMRLFQQSGIFHFDATAVPNTKIADLNWAKLDRYFDQYSVDFSNESDKERLLINTDLMTIEGEVTVAGLLVFGINPQKFLHNASISFAHFAGSALEDTLLDKQVIEGTLDYQIDTCVAIIKNNIQTPSVISVCPFSRKKEYY